MTNPAAHGYRHVPRRPPRWLQSGSARLAAAVSWAAVAVVTLAPVAVDRVALPVLLAVPERAAVPQPTPTLERDPLDVLVSALRECSTRMSVAQRHRLAAIIEAESAAHGWDPLFIAALVQVESGCRPSAVGGGAIGLTQMLPSTAREVARRAGVRWRGPRMLTEPTTAVQLGLRYLGELEDMFDDPYKAVAAYNMGPAPVMRMSSQRARGTRYVRKILSRYERLLDQYA